MSDKLLIEHHLEFLSLKGGSQDATLLEITCQCSNIVEEGLNHDLESRLRSAVDNISRPGPILPCRMILK